MRPDLHERHVLVVEDEFFIADEICQALGRSGARVMGPAPDISAARRLLEREPPDCAVLDINLRGQMVFELADELQARSVPFVFATGYGSPVIPPRFAAVERFEKPLPIPSLLEALARNCSARS